MAWEAEMSKKHVLIMALCCVIPLIAIGAVTIFRIPLNSVIYFGLILLCPIAHLLMMKGMMHANGHEHHESQSQTISFGKPLAYPRSGEPDNE
jgi:uncharacterized membrane protein